MTHSEDCDSQLEIKVKKATERISENIHIIANEPSLAFYRLQEHVRKALPFMVEKRMDVMKLQYELQGKCYDVDYAVSPRVFGNHTILLLIIPCKFAIMASTTELVIRYICYKRDRPRCANAVKSIESSEHNFQNIQELLRNTIFYKQQLKYKESRRNKDSSSVYKRLSAHITLDLPDLPELSDALRETASKVESIVNQARTGNFPSSEEN